MPGYDMWVHAKSDSGAQTTRLYVGADLDEADDKLVFYAIIDGAVIVEHDYTILRRGRRASGNDPIPFGLWLAIPFRIGEGEAQIDIEDRLRFLPGAAPQEIVDRFGRWALRLTFWKGTGADRRIVTGFDYPMGAYFSYRGGFARAQRPSRQIDRFGNGGYDRFTNFYGGVPVEDALRNAGIGNNSLLGLEVTIDVGRRPVVPYFYNPLVYDPDPQKDRDFRLSMADYRFWAERMDRALTQIPPRTQYDPPATAGDFQDGYQPNPWGYQSIGPLIPPPVNENFRDFYFWAKRSDGLIDPSSARLQIDGTIDTVLLQTLTIETRWQRRLEDVRLFEVDGREWILASMARRERDLVELSLQAVRETAPGGN